MGFWFQRLQSLSPRPPGEVLKSNYYMYIIRVLILLGTTTSLACLLLAWADWAQPVNMQNFNLYWDKNRSALSSDCRTNLKAASPSAAVPAPPSPPTRDDLHGNAQKRGIGLLHSWADSELFLRAVQNEKWVAAQINSTSRKPKIAFMFLIRNDIPFSSLWNKFFKGHEGLYNIYVHMWPLKLHAFQKSKGPFFGRLIPSQEGARLTPGLIADARRLMANALLDDPANEWFALVSESCIPIHGFRHAYKTLASTNKSFVDSGSQFWDMWSRYKARGDDAMKPEIEFRQFRKGSQFWVMRRRHALMTVGDSKYWSKFNRPCLQKYSNCFPEEHYFATLINILDPNGWFHTATHVDWSKMEDGGHPRRFRGWEINADFIRDLQRKWLGELLFARKFHADCLDPLLENASVILDH